MTIGTASSNTLRFRKICVRHPFRNSVIARWGAAFLGPHFFIKLGTLPRYLVEWDVYKKAATEQQLSFQDSYPCLTDRVKATPFDPHYFFQAAWLARRVHQAVPPFHVDIGSSVMMINVLSASAKTIFVDYRPLRVQLSNLLPLGGDIVRLPFRSGAIASLSCLHVIEHVGLGRYGDPINPVGSQLAAAELQRVLQPGGRLFLSVPVGRERVCFNAHRVFSPSTIRAFFPELQLKSFSLVDDSGQLHEGVPLEAAVKLDYGCGLFEFVKARE
jgi:SAM-dependent methyltransferase